MNMMPKTVPEGFDAWMMNGGGNCEYRARGSERLLAGSTYVRARDRDSTLRLEPADIAPAFQINAEATGLLPSLKPTPGVKSCGITGEGTGCFQGTTDPTNYSTAVIGNASVAWIRKVVSEDPSRPFFAYIAPKAAHEPFNPAPWYEGYWHEDWPQTEPRPSGSWNSSAATRANHHGNVGQVARGVGRGMGMVLSTTELACVLISYNSLTDSAPHPTPHPPLRHPDP